MRVTEGRPFISDVTNHVLIDVGFHRGHPLDSWDLRCIGRWTGLCDSIDLCLFCSPVYGSSDYRWTNCCCCYADWSEHKWKTIKIVSDDMQVSGVCRKKSNGGYLQLRMSMNTTGMYWFKNRSRRLLTFCENYHSIGIRLRQAPAIQIEIMLYFVH